MARILIVADIHLSDRPPSSCTASYADDLFDLLGQTVEIARAHKAAAVVWAGDVFHCTAPSRTSHQLVQRTIAVGQAYRDAGAGWYIVPGNHDLQNHRLESVYDTQPLGVLLRAGARLLRGWANPDSPRHGLPVYGVPWVQGYGAEDHRAAEAVHAELKAYREWAQQGLVIAHAPLYPPGLELPYEFFPAGDFAAAMGGRGACYYGHVHEHHGDWACDGVAFANYGALSRGSLHEHNLTREVAVALWDSQGGLFARVPLKARPAEEVFRLQEAREMTDARGKLDAFMASIGATTLQVLSVESVQEHVRGLGLDPAVQAEIEELLQWSVHQ